MLLEPHQMTMKNRIQYNLRETIVVYPFSFGSTAFNLAASTGRRENPVFSLNNKRTEIISQ